MTRLDWSTLALREHIAADRSSRSPTRPAGMPRRRWRRFLNPHRRYRRLRSLPMWERFALERSC